MFGKINNINNKLFDNKRNQNIERQILKDNIEKNIDYTNINEMTKALNLYNETIELIDKSNNSYQDREVIKSIIDLIYKFKPKVFSIEQQINNDFFEKDLKLLTESLKYHFEFNENLLKENKFLKSEICDKSKSIIKTEIENNYLNLKIKKLSNKIKDLNNKNENKIVLLKNQLNDIQNFINFFILHFIILPLKFVKYIILFIIEFVYLLFLKIICLFNKNKENEIIVNKISNKINNNKDLDE